MISTDITRSTIDATVDRGRTLGTSAGADVCTAMTTPADYRTEAELRVPTIAGGHVWLRPAALDVFVPATQGHLAWSPPT